MTKKMALSNRYSASNTDFLHPDKNPQTYTSRETNDMRLRWNNREAILLCSQNSSANSTRTKSYLKDTTDFIYFIDKTSLPKGVNLVSMEVTSLYPNIPEEEGINIVCTAYETFYNETTPLTRKSTKTDFATTLVPIQQTELVANTQNRRGH